MRRPDLLIGLILVFVFFNSIIFSAATSIQSAEDDPLLNQLILSVYVDEGGRCLITGYVEDPESLPFLNSSEYSIDDESRQLYAITNALTSKSADSWSLRFESPGIYEEYRIIFYLPENAKLSGVDSSYGLDYLVYAANRSVVAEVYGHDILDPAVEIGYALQIDEATAALADTVTSAGSNAGISNLKMEILQYVAILITILLLIGAVFLIRSSRRRSKPLGPEKCPAAHEHMIKTQSSGHRNAEHEDQVQSAQKNDDSEEFRAGMADTSEISAVMATLTDKEQSVLKLLLQRGGRMVQRDISYETDISKSSLSGILTSMEKRKLITKREKGRTNIIELSERFKNNKEQF